MLFVGCCNCCCCFACALYIWVLIALVNCWSLHLLVFYAGLVVYLLFVALVICCMLFMLWLIDLMFDSLFDGSYGRWL